MNCIFCKSETKAIHLDLEFPLCQTCVELRDFVQEYQAEKQEGQGPIEWATAYLSLVQSEAATA